jgi:hypothetical protein
VDTQAARLPACCGHISPAQQQQQHQHHHQQQQQQRRQQLQQQWPRCFGGCGNALRVRQGWGRSMAAGQGQWQHVPATHKQLLDLFEISTEAAVWVAAVMAHSGLPSIDLCWLCWQRQHAMQGVNITSTELQLHFSTDPYWPAVDPAAVTEALRPHWHPQPQPQPWSGMLVLLLELLQPVLLYGATYATVTAEDDSSLCSAFCSFAASAVAAMEAGRKDIAWTSSNNSSSSSSSSSAEQSSLWWVQV